MGIICSYKLFYLGLRFYLKEYFHLIILHHRNNARDYYCYNNCMNIFEMSVVFIFLIISIISFVTGLDQSIKKSNPHGETPYFVWLGIFVWGDGIIIGPFWFISSLFAFFMKDWQLFLLMISVFWVVRSLGETYYWLNQQFVKNNSNYYQKLTGYRFFKNDTILFIYQIIWQCVSVVSIIASIYFANLWLSS